MILTDARDAKGIDCFLAVGLCDKFQPDLLPYALNFAAK